MARRVSAPLDCAFEHPFWSCGWSRVAGVDEVGRGAMAGPLVAAAIVLPPMTAAERQRLAPVLDRIRDSKVLSPDERERLVEPLTDIALAVAVGLVEAEELDDIGIVAANRLAMERAVLSLPVEPHALLIDATTLDLGLPQVGLIDGDARCLSIAAASILAKVTRDRIMVSHDARDPRYGFAVHKGYATRSHLAALMKHGPSALHRKTFAPVAQAGFCPGEDDR